MISKDPFIYTDNFLFLSLHQFILLSLFQNHVEDRQTDKASYRSDFPLLENLQLPAKFKKCFGCFPVDVKVEN